MKVIEDATLFAHPTTGPNHWLEHYRSPHMSVGTYSIPIGGIDDQTPHREEEIYVVVGGRARLVVENRSVPVHTGSVVQVAADEEHHFEDIEEDLTLLVIFAPPYSGA